MGLREVIKKYIGVVLAGALSGAAGTSGVLYYDGVKEVFTCIGEIEWQSKD